LNNGSFTIDKDFYIKTITFQCLLKIAGSSKKPLLIVCVYLQKATGSETDLGIWSPSVTQRQKGINKCCQMFQTQNKTRAHDARPCIQDESKLGEAFTHKQAPRTNN